MRILFVYLSLVLVTIPAAHADLTVKSTITFDDPKLRAYMPKFSAQQKAQLRNNVLIRDGVAQTQYYVSGQKTRLDLDDISMLIDTRLKTNQCYLHTAVAGIHVFWVQPYQNTIKPSTSVVPVIVQKTGQLKTILNHTAEKCIVSGEVGGGSHVEGAIWCLHDIPNITDNIDGTLTTNVVPIFSSIWHQIPGLPVLFDLTFVAKDGSKVRYSYKVNVLITSPISSSIFLIPPGYHNMS